MKKLCVSGLCGLLLAFWTVPSAFAMTEFKKAFEDRYVKDSKNEEFKALAKKEGCAICHMKGTTDRKLRNKYGEELAKLIEGNVKERNAAAADKAAEKAKQLEELQAAFAKVDEMKTDEKKDDSPTYGELLKEGKITWIEEVKKDEAKKTE